ncbi:MAG TPA: ABC transporter substrate-binding protein [Polyangia bacterium]|nr:ABC transporter substrate-binding protein [Polyangia bacterium]
MYRKSIVTALALALCSTLPAAAQKAAAPGKVSGDVVKIGILTDMSGVYSDLGGQGAIIAAQMAIDDFGGKVLGKPIMLVSADHQNKADVGTNKAREWFDRDGVDMVTDLLNSGVALGVSNVAKEKNRIAIVVGAGSTDLTGDKCNANTIHYAYDNYALANITGNAVVKKGGDTWFFLTADYAFGQSLEKNTSEVVKKAGGKVLGSVRHPLSTADFSSYLLQAQASKAKIIGLANAGGDTINAIKAANEFGIVEGGQKFAGLLVFITDVHSLGLQAAQGMLLTDGFYWDMNDDTRKWSDRFLAKHKARPTMVQAGDYSAVLHYLKAVQAAGTDEAQAVMAKMREIPVNDVFAKNGKVREDGRMVHDMFLAQVKSPGESKRPWDYYKIVEVVPGDKAFRPLSQSTCPLVKK